MLLQQVLGYRCHKALRVNFPGSINLQTLWIRSEKQKPPENLKLSSGPWRYYQVPFLFLFGKGALDVGESLDVGTRWQFCHPNTRIPQDMLVVK